MKTIRYDEDQYEWRYDLDAHTTLVAATREELEQTLRIVNEFLRNQRKESHEHLRH